MKLFRFAAVVLSLNLLGSAFAADYGQVRRAADRCTNWLIGQYHVKEKVFGSGPDAATPEEAAAMVVKGICESPRDFKEANGPYITEPLKRMIASVNEKNELSGAKIAQSEALQWATGVSALKATENPTYAPLIEKLRAHAKELPPPQVPELNASLLTPTTATRESMRNALSAIHKFHGTQGEGTRHRRPENQVGRGARRCPGEAAETGRLVRR